MTIELNILYIATHLNVDVLRMSRALAEILMGSSEPVPQQKQTEHALALLKAQWWAEAEARFRFLKADAMIKVAKELQVE